MEIIDRFGNLPQDVSLLFDTIELKVLAGNLFVSHLILKNENLKIYFSEEVEKNDTFFSDILPKFMNEKKTKIQFLNQPKKLGIEIQLHGNSKSEKIEFAKNILKYI